MAVRHDQEFFEAFRPLRNRLRSLNGQELINTALERLHNLDFSNPEIASQQPPWHLLLVLKWVFLYNDLTNTGRRVTEYRFNDVINSVHKLANDFSPTQDAADIFMVLRGAAFQQFWQQQESITLALSRQHYFFYGLEDTHRIRSWFNAECSIDLDVWLDLAFMTAAHFQNDRNDRISKGHFNALSPPLRDHVEQFIETLAQNAYGQRSYLQSLDDANIRRRSELIERTPLTRYPLLSIDTWHTYFFLPVFNYAVEHFVYDRLRARSAIEFMRVFGPMFEKYVNRGLECLGEPYIKEDEIKGKVQEAGGVVDFLVSGDNGNVCIDAKAVEASNREIGSYRPEVVSNRLKASVLKGIRQAASTLNAFDLKNRESNYLVIVTFKKLYLGHGSFFRRQVMRERLESAMGSTIETSIIPIENMFFISIDEYDRLICALQENEQTLAQFLSACVARNNRAETMRLELDQHLAAIFGGIKPPPYLSAENDRIIDRLSNYLQ